MKLKYGQLREWWHNNYAYVWKRIILWVSILELMGSEEKIM